MSLDALDYATIPRAVEVSQEPSPMCPVCGHRLGWHTWHVVATHDGRGVKLDGLCQGPVFVSAGHPAGVCGCHPERALTP